MQTVVKEPSKYMDMLFPQLDAYIQKLLAEQDMIPAERQQTLQQLANYISKRGQNLTQLNFICTHNSRRSHISQIWAATAAQYFGLEHLMTYSAGTEATAFNPRAVAAMERIGFQVNKPGGDNPRYEVHMGLELPPLVCFSKTINDAANPTSNFAAIMTCSDADENCPVVLGADWRLALTYEDPKVADDTPAETDRYDERVQQIGRELVYAFGLVRSL